MKHLRKSIGRSPSRLALLFFPLVVAGSLLLWGAGAEAIAETYTTNFPLTENPISEDGHWINGLTNGIDWADVATTPGKAFGTQTGIGPNFADSTALLTGNWGPTQTVQAVVYIASGDSTTFEEVELRLRSSLSAHSCTGYEVNFSVKPDNPYCQIVRWNGPLGDFTLLDARSVGVVNGDVVKATAVGSTITCYINITAIFSVNDISYPSGNPGMGFYLQGGLGPPLNYGFSSYTASDGTQTPTPTPTATTTPIPSAATTDFNGDGHPDWVVRYAATGQTAIVYMNNNVAIGAALGPTLTPGWALRGVADLNLDGHPDYAVFAPNTFETAIWYLSGPTFIGSAVGPTLPSGWALEATADFNGDGHPDWVIRHAATGQTAIVYLNNNVVIGAALGPPLPNGWSLVGVADFNGDGHPDYALFIPSEAWLSTEP